MNEDTRVKVRKQAPRIHRKVKLEVPNLPIWGVQPFFDMLHHRLHKPNVVGDVKATLLVEYDLDADQYEIMHDLQDRLWQPFWVEVEEVKVYEPKDD
jgi:hypothetical protein